MDDLLLYAQDEPGLIDTVEQMPQFCAKRNIELHPAKCLFFAKEIRLGCRIVSKSSIMYDPRRLDGLLNMEPPVIGDNLQQSICALQ